MHYFNLLENLIIVPRFSVNTLKDDGCIGGFLQLKKLLGIPTSTRKSQKLIRLGMATPATHTLSTPSKILGMHQASLCDYLM